MARATAPLLPRVLLAAVLGLPAAGAPVLQHAETSSTEAKWLAESLQLPSGAISHQSDAFPRFINPYFSNLAATALTRDATRLPAVKKYILWYFAHLNWPDNQGLHGTVYDYQVDSAGTERSLQSYDSADSYAATFITLLRAYHEASGDTALLKAYKYQLDVIGGVMVKLKDTDHLTVAKPNYRVKYLMDNCEVQKGLSDLAFLMRNVLGDARAADWYQVHANQVKTAVLTELSNGTTFYVSKTDDGAKAPVNWSIWYPHSVAQMFPLVFGLLAPDSPRAKALYAELNKPGHQGGWESQNKDAFPWTVMGYAAILLGDTARAETFYARMRSQYITATPQHPYPWHVGEVGWFLHMNARMH